MSFLSRVYLCLLKGGSFENQYSVATLEKEITILIVLTLVQVFELASELVS